MSSNKSRETSLSEFEDAVRGLTGGGDTSNTEARDPTKKEDGNKDADQEDEK